MNQLDLNGQEHTVGTPDLTQRQQQALTFVQCYVDGVTADEAGAAMHSIRRRHPADQRCEWCARDGRGVLEALVKKGFLRRRRGGERGTGYLYVPADQGSDADAVSWAQGDLPEGF